MARAAAPLPPAFAQLEQRLASLIDLYNRGQLTFQNYQNEVQKLLVVDPSGQTWWLGGAPGAWHWWNGQSWVPGSPSIAVPASGSAVSPPKGVQRFRLKISHVLGLVLVLGLVTVGAFLIAGYIDSQSFPAIVEGVAIPDSAPPHAALSEYQQSVRNQLGPPQAFSILFFEEVLSDGSVGDVRCETWSYYTQGEEYTFLNGELVSRDPVEVDFSQLIPAQYLPEQFSAYMSMEEVTAAARLESYLVVPLENEVVQSGAVYYGPQLTFGLQNDELRYVESLVLYEEE